MSACPKMSHRELSKEDLQNLKARVDYQASQMREFAEEVRKYESSGSWDQFWYDEEKLKRMQRNSLIANGEVSKITLLMTGILHENDEIIKSQQEDIKQIQEGTKVHLIEIEKLNKQILLLMNQIIEFKTHMAKRLDEAENRLIDMSNRFCTKENLNSFQAKSFQEGEAARNAMKDIVSGQVVAEESLTKVMFRLSELSVNYESHNSRLDNIKIPEVEWYQKKTFAYTSAALLVMNLILNLYSFNN